MGSQPLVLGLQDIGIGKRNRLADMAVDDRHGSPLRGRRAGQHVEPAECGRRKPVGLGIHRKLDPESLAHGHHALDAPTSKSTFRARAGKVSDSNAATASRYFIARNIFEQINLAAKITVFSKTENPTRYFGQTPDRGNVTLTLFLLYPRDPFPDVPIPGSISMMQNSRRALRE